MKQVLQAEDSSKANQRGSWTLRARKYNCRVGEVVRILRTAAPNAHVLLQAVLPRGAAWVGLAQWQWPNRFSKPIEAINTKFQVGAVIVNHALTTLFQVGVRFFCHVLCKCTS